MLGMHNLDSIVLIASQSFFIIHGESRDATTSTFLTWCLMRAKAIYAVSIPRTKNI
jgi:hypothetical protein